MKKKQILCFGIGLRGVLLQKGSDLPIVGAEELLRRIGQRGARIVAVTSMPCAEAEQTLERVGMRGYFERVFGCDDLSFPKTKREAYGELTERIGVPAESMAILDADAEVICAAKAAGLYGIGFGQDVALAACCDTLLKSYSDLDYLGREIPLHRVRLGLGGGALLQVANRSHTQMMSYVIDTPDGSCVVIDGGNHRPEDAKHLETLIRARGGRVYLWIINHAHGDHLGALLWLLKQERFDIEIDRICFSFPPAEWFLDFENGKNYHYVKELFSALSARGIRVEELVAGTRLQVGGMSFSVLGGCRNYERYTTVNDTTVVVKAHFPTRDVLFLGDLGVDGGRDLVEECGAEALRCDVVQMAHHGQNGVRKDFYEIVRPKICLYTTPDWLWNNDNGGGVGSGEWKTLETRRWMEELGVEASYPSADGDYLFE